MSEEPDDKAVVSLKDLRREVQAVAEVVGAAVSFWRNAYLGAESARDSARRDARILAVACLRCKRFRHPGQVRQELRAIAPYARVVLADRPVEKDPFFLFRRLPELRKYRAVGRKAVKRDPRQ